MVKIADDVALQIPITADPNPFKQVMTDVKNSVSGAMDNVKKSMQGVKEAFGAAGLLATNYLKGAVDSAAKAEESTARLKTIVENQGQNWDKAKGQVDQFTKGIMNLSTYSGGQAKEALTVLEQRGVKLNDALGMQNTLVNLAAGKNIELSEASNILADAYNGKTRALLSLGLATKDEIKNGISFDEVQKRINHRFNGSASAQLNTYNGQMKQFNNNMNSFKSSIGSFLLPYFTKMAKYLDDIAKKINGLSPQNKKLIAEVLGLTAVFGTLIGGASLMQKTMSFLGPTVQGLGGMIGGLMGPVGLVVAGIALLTVAYMKNWGGIKDKTNEVVNFIKPLIINGFNSVVSWFKTNWPAIKATFEEILQGLVNAYNTVLKPVLNFIIIEIGKVIQWVQQNWPLIKETITTVFNAIKSIIESVLGWIINFWKNHGSTIITIVKNDWNIIKTVIDTVMHVIGDVIQVVMNIITGHWGKAWQGIKDIVKTVFGGALNIIKDILGNIGSVFGDIIKTAYNWGANLINGFIDGIKSRINAVKDIAHTVIKTVKDFMGFNSPSKEGEGRNIVKWGANMVGGFMDGIKQQIPNLQFLMNNVIKAPNINGNLSLSGAGGTGVSKTQNINFYGDMNLMNQGDKTRNLAQLQYLAPLI